MLPLPSAAPIQLQLRALICQVTLSHGRISSELVAFDRTAKTASRVSAGNFLANSGHSCSAAAAAPISAGCLDART
jgi:hypothetical protein